MGKPPDKHRDHRCLGRIGKSTLVNHRLKIDLSLLLFNLTGNKNEEITCLEFNETAHGISGPTISSSSPISSLISCKLRLDFLSGHGSLLGCGSLNPTSHHDLLFLLNFPNFRYTTLAQRRKANGTV